MTDSSSVLRKLHNWQMLLLDLMRANRLLYFKTDRASSVPITSPASADLFQELVTQGKKLTFATADEKVVFEEEPQEAPPTSIDGARPATPATSAPDGAEPNALQSFDAIGSAADVAAPATEPTGTGTVSEAADTSATRPPADQSAGHPATPAEAGLNRITPRPHNNTPPH
jgi:hypothetical protein